jgi:predicted nuclease of predicted toxin-antitoxin system
VLGGLRGSQQPIPTLIDSQMLRLLIDHDLDQDILRGLLRRVPDLDAVTAYEIGKSEAPDPELLAWAAEAGRVLVTHDRRTMPAHAARRLAAGNDIAAVIIVSRRIPISIAIDELEIAVMCSEPEEWHNLVRHIPL